MTRHALPFPHSTFRALRIAANSAVHRLGTPARRPRILLVTGDALDAKIDEVRTRLEYLLSHLEEPFELHRKPKASPLDYIRNVAVVAVDAKAMPHIARRYIRWAFDLDYETNVLDGWALMDLGVEVSGADQRRVVARARQTFVNRIEALRADGPRPAYIFGTGPSLALAAEHSFDDGTVIVCNTIVRDPKLWHHLAPAILTAGDAIYHFGHTAHARAFRADALQRLRESEGRTLFVYPAPYDPVVRAEFREVESVLIPIPWGDHSDISVNLTEDFLLPRVQNALNGLLLPLGCTVSNDVRLWGFDGRAPTDEGFWANSNRHTYPELMQSIRDAHPAFFEYQTPVGDETKYVKTVHGDWLDERLSEAESRGFKFRMLHRSWTPTLQKRFSELTVQE